MPPSAATKQRKGAAAPRATAKPTAPVEPTKSAQLINQRQSTDVVQTLLHGSISCLSYVRNLFPEGCFDDQVYENSNDPWSYEEYAAGKGTSKEGTKMKVLRRGRNQNVDQLLDWLEKGAFEALKLNVLRAIQLSVLEDANDPSKVVETYTFTFNYLRSPQTGVQTLTGLQVQGPRGKAVTVKNAKYALQSFIRRLMTFCATLPNLPERRFLSMHLFYMPECDHSYQPTGFHESTDDSIRFPNNSDIGWIRSTQEGGMVDAGYHTVGLKVSHLEQANDEEPTETNGELHIPTGLEYTEVVAREDDIDLMMIFDLPADPLVLDKAVFERLSLGSPSANMEGSRSGTAESRPTLTTTGDGVTSSHAQVNSKGVGGGLEETAAKNAGPAASTAAPAALQHAESGIAARPREATPVRSDVVQSTGSDSQVRTQLREMMRDSPQGPNLEETQQVEQPLAPKSLRTLQQNASLQLSQSKLSELKIRGKSAARPSTGSEWDQKEDIVDCQCGCKEEEDGMINCSFCDTWQHVHCYGYRGIDDGRIPSIHACYRCLLQDKEAPLLRELKNLALLRKGMHVILESGFTDDQKFANKLRCDLQTAAGVSRHLRGKGFVVSVPGYKRRGFSQTGKAPYVAASTQPLVDQMMNEYFDPMTKVAHHYVTLQYRPDATVDETAATLPPPPESAHSVQNGDTTVAMDSSDAVAHRQAASSWPHKQTGVELGQVGDARNGRQGSTRYSLRQRGSQNKVSRSERPPSPDPTGGSKTHGRGKKRSGQSEEQSGEKRYKSSISSGLISIGHEGSPTPSAVTMDLD